MKYKKKPIIIEAIQWTGENIDEVKNFIGNESHFNLAPIKACFNVSLKTIEIETLEGTMVASIGDYIINGVKGEYYPCKPDIFDQTYELDKGVL